MLRGCQGTTQVEPRFVLTSACSIARPTRLLKSLFQLVEVVVVDLAEASVFVHADLPLDGRRFGLPGRFRAISEGSSTCRR